MSLPRPEYEEQIARHLDTERQARRDYWRDMLRMVLQLTFWVAAGLLLIGWSLHTRDAALGAVLFLAGQTVWLSGVLFTLLAAYRRGERRGDW